MPRMIAIWIVLALGREALAQNFNVDLNLSAGSGSGVPASTFGAAAAQPGYWNDIDAMGPDFVLQDLAGNDTTVTLGTSPFMVPRSWDDPYGTGNFAKLMEDAFQLEQEDFTGIFSFTGLEAGTYFVFTYADDPGSDLPKTRVMINGETQIVGGAHDINEFAWGVTHARHLVRIQPGDNLVVWITSNPDVQYAHGVACGFQTRKLPTRLYVDAGAPPGGNGLTWATAFNQLFDALDAAPEYGGAIEEVWVAEGVYHPTTDGLDRGASFRLLNGAAIYGGFAGGETSLDERDPVAHPVLLSGSIGGFLPYDNSINVLTMWVNAGESDDALLDGFTVIGGYAASAAGLPNGAGLWVIDGTPTIRNCRFVGNVAVEGGAVYVTAGAPLFIDCEFVSNTATSTGGAFANDPGVGSSASFLNCRFHGNDASYQGGAVYTEVGTSAFVNCVFTGSDSQWEGGAIHARGDGTVLNLYNCALAGNTTNSAGGAVALAQGAHANVSNSILWDNHGAGEFAGQVESQIFLNDATIAMGYTTVQFYFSFPPGDSNNGLDPQFVAADGGDGYGDLNDNLRLSAASPLIDSGNNADLPWDAGDIDGDGILLESFPIDLDGQVRRVDDPATADTGGGTSPIVDRGAYEFAPVGLVGDLNCDGLLNTFDIDPFVLALTSAPSFAAYHVVYPDCDGLLADINGDGLVNAFDIDQFVMLLTARPDEPKPPIPAPMGR